MPSSFSCDGFSSNEPLKKFPPEGQETDQVFLFLEIKQTKIPLQFTGTVMSVVPVCGSDRTVLPALFFVPFLPRTLCPMVNEGFAEVEIEGEDTTVDLAGPLFRRKQPFGVH